MYSMDHDGTWLANLSELDSGYITPDCIMSTEGAPFKFENININSDSNPDDIVIIDNSIQGCTNILYADGHVTTQ